MKGTTDFRVAGALFISIICFFAFLGSYPLLDNNEGLYAGIPLWMTQTGNYILPRLNGVIYIEKPPMLYWLVALQFNIFGVSEWSARLIPAISGFTIGLLLYWFLKHENRKDCSIWVLLVWSASVGIIAFSRVIFFDMLFTMFFSILLVSLFIYRQDRKKKRWIYLAYTMAALSVLTKGLIGLVLPALTMFVYTYCEQSLNPWYSLKRLWAVIKDMFAYFSVVGMIIFFVIALPWHIAVAQQDPEFWRFYFINEHFARFLGTRQPDDYYEGPIYYYVLRLLGYMAPWIIFLLAFIWRDKPKASEKTQSLERFCWCWFMVVLVFFSISKAKANYYIVAGMPPLIILFTFRMREAREFIYKHFIFIILNIVFILASIALILVHFVPSILGKLAQSFSWAVKLNEIIQPFTGYLSHVRIPLFIAFAATLAGLFITWHARKRSDRREYYVWTLAAYVAIMLSIGMSQFHLIQDNYTSKKIIADITKQYDKKDVNLYMYIDFEEISTIPFYFERPAVMIKWASHDLWYGMNKPCSEGYKVTVDEFLKLPDDRPIFILMEKRRQEEFAKLTAPAGFKVWKTYGLNDKRVVFFRDKTEKQLACN